MSIVQALKECEGCKRRRSFLKGVLLFVLGMFMLPRRTQALQCSAVLTCPNEQQIILCCDPGCETCHIYETANCINIYEVCGGQGELHGICCPACPPHCIGIGLTSTDKQTWWEVSFDDNKSVVYVHSSDPNSDPLDRWRRGLATLRDKDKNLRTAVSARKL